MSLYTWSKDYSVGIPEIDDEHKALFDLINRLFDSISHGKANEILVEVINNLIVYTENHFKREQNLFAKINYPHAKEHKALHEAFIDKVAHIKNQIDGKKDLPSVELISFLSQWLVQHIQGADMAYVPYFKSNI